MRPQDLKQGACYFLVTYHDEALRLPEIMTYVYLGEGIFGRKGAADEPRWFFQTAESHATDGAFDPKTHEPGEQLLAVGSDMIEEFRDLAGLIETLRERQSRR